jgi:hypothetical protein
MPKKTFDRQTTTLSVFLAGSSSVRCNCKTSRSEVGSFREYALLTRMNRRTRGNDATRLQGAVVTPKDNIVPSILVSKFVSDKGLRNAEGCQRVSEPGRHTPGLIARA